MARRWYPVIDQEKCNQCGICVNMCGNGVYDKQKAPVPCIVNPIKCVHGCHGCGNRCPNGAITYYGDRTGWTPPNQNQEGCCNSSSC